MPIRFNGLLIWLLALLAHVGLVGIYTKPDLRFWRLNPDNAFASTDPYLEVLTGQPHLSAHLFQILDQLPLGEAIVLVLPDDGIRSAFINQNVSYFSWPREVRWLSEKSPGIRDESLTMQAEHPHDGNAAALIFWDTEPLPHLPTGIKIGPHQIVVPRNWTPTLQ